MVRMPCTVGSALSSTSPPPLTCRSMKPGASQAPVGRTRVEIVCQGKRVSVSVNGTVVNEVSDASPASGRILLQCEGFEVFFRKFELHPLPKAEEKKP